MIPINIATELRIIFRIISETFKGINRTGLMNIVIVGTMAAILSIFGCMFRTSIAISSFVEQMGSSLEASVYLKSHYEPQEMTDRILSIRGVKSVKIITKEQAWSDLKKQMDVPNIKNPLPDTLRVKLRPQANSNKIVDYMKTMSGVEGIQFPKQLADKVQQVSNITNVAIVIILLFLGGVTLFIISNTIQLVIQARKQEIEIMRMMGVSNWYIKSPYILQGAFYGFCGAIISLIPIDILQGYLNQFLSFFQVTAPAMNSNIVMLCVLMMGIFVGAGGSIISVRKYLAI